MTDLNRELEETLDKAEQLKRQIAAASCREVGHDWVFIGGRNVGCTDMGESCSCSTSVHVCSKCDDCDYGDTPERDQVIEKCRLTGCGN